MEPHWPAGEAGPAPAAGRRGPGWGPSVPPSHCPQAHVTSPCAYLCLAVDRFPHVGHCPRDRLGGCPGCRVPGLFPGAASHGCSSHLLSQKGAESTKSSTPPGWAADQSLPVGPSGQPAACPPPRPPSHSHRCCAQGSPTAEALAASEARVCGPVTGPAAMTWFLSRPSLFSAASLQPPPRALQGVCRWLGARTARLRVSMSRNSRNGPYACVSLFLPLRLKGKMFFWQDHRVGSALKAFVLGLWEARLPARLPPQHTHRQHHHCHFVSCFDFRLPASCVALWGLRVS